MGRFRSNPVEIEAVQWLGFNERKMREFVTEHVSLPDDTLESIRADEQQGTLNIWCAKGASTVTLNPNDWLIAEADASGVYPCEAGVFALRYTRLVDNEAKRADL
jgi:hypothetical protein